MSFLRNGVLSEQEIGRLAGMPSEARLAKGPVVVIECPQEIPCDPCETACPHGAITIGEPIVNIPCLVEEVCTGCALCIASCPGQAIFVVDMTHGQETASVQLPYEFVPLPRQGEIVAGLNRLGEEVCRARVTRVVSVRRFDRTSVVTVVVPKEFGMEVRNIRLYGDR